MRESSERRPHFGHFEIECSSVAPQWRQAGFCFTTPLIAGSLDPHQGVPPAVRA
jgi:hypothetical protein